MLFDPQRWVMPEIPAEPTTKPKVRRKKKQVKQLEPWRKLLLDAAELIKAKGWCRERAYNKGAYCAIGAMMSVATGVRGSKVCEGPTPHLVVVAEGKVLNHINKLGRFYGYIANWNDSQTRGKTVIEVLQEVARS